ncbi:hypothetical protein HPB47_024508 [Ixodes persulcatus]|uniref:Uncharacterized protein n=1 Tax=Ixodes persulcatus TaxID=34615 RepID=A0AC60Q5B0_IXOPE|nr:hypothetical protein HPB47_024508 [Ixodes persulcatus]
MDLQATETSAGQPDSLSLTRNTAAAPAAAVACPPSIIIRPHPTQGKLLDLSPNVRVISTAKHGQKRARGTLSSVSTAASTRSVMSTNQTRGVEMEAAPTPSDASTQDPTLEESDWQRVTYRRKKNSRLASESSSSGRPIYQHTVILNPHNHIDEAITRHISTYLKIDNQHDLPKFLTRYLNRSNQIAVDAAETRVRDALVTIDHLPIKGQVVPFQAYETIRHGQIRGIIRNAGGMLATELMQNLHCRKCEILSARPLGEHQHQLPQTDLDQRLAQLEQTDPAEGTASHRNAIERRFQYDLSLLNTPQCIHDWAKHGARQIQHLISLGQLYPTVHVVADILISLRVGHFALASLGQRKTMNGAARSSTTLSNTQMRGARRAPIAYPTPPPQLPDSYKTPFLTRSIRSGTRETTRGMEFFSCEANPEPGKPHILLRTSGLFR